MAPSPEQLARELVTGLRAVRRKYNTPAKARQFLIRAGILEKHAAAKNGVRLAGPYRPTAAE